MIGDMERKESNEATDLGTQMVPYW